MANLGVILYSLYRKKRTFLYFAALFNLIWANLIHLLLYFPQGKRQINSYLGNIRQTWLIFDVFIILYIGKSTLFILISAKYGKLGRAAALFSLFYTIFELLFFYSIQGKRQLIHFYSFCIGKKTIFNKIQLNFGGNYCSIQFDKG